MVEKIDGQVAITNLLLKAEKDVTGISLDELKALADLSTIQANRIEPLQMQREKTAGLSATSEEIKLQKLRPDRIHVITNICLIETPTGKPQVLLGIMSKGEKFYIMSQTVQIAEDSVTWVGQVIGLEYDEIFAEVQGATATDKIILTAFGYSVRL
jgi:hypothetical protein